MNYAALRNALAIKYQITSDKSGHDLRTSITFAFSIMDMIIKKNAAIYNKYKSEDSLKLYV